MRATTILSSVSCAAFCLLASTSAVAQTTAPSKPAATKPDATKAARDKEHAEKKATAESDKQTVEQQNKHSETPNPDEGHAHHEEQEAKRAIFVSGDLAFTRPDLGGISDNLGFDKTGANGVLYGLAAGLRLRDLRFGARWRVFDTTEFSLWSIAGSVGYGLPIRPLSPVFTLTAGYVWDQKTQPGLVSSSIPRGSVLPPDVDLRGLLVGVDINASYWVTKFLRLGAFIGSDFMFLHRPQATVPDSIFGAQPEFASKPLYTDSGSGVAYTLNLGFRGAFDVGF